MKRSLNWKTATFIVAVGGLKLLGLLLGAVKPHLVDAAGVGLGIDVTAAAALVAPLPEVTRSWGNGGGKTGDSSAHHIPRVRLHSDRRDGAASTMVTVQVTSSSR